jgi:holo-[acyl-carrier protein] synthase
VAVVGHGVDAVDIDRFRRVLARRPGLAPRVFTDAEQAYAASCADPSPRLAVRFAAKEAVLKSMGAGIGAASLRDVEVVRGTDGAPHLALGASAAALARDKGISRFHVSLTHTDTLAVASVVAENTVTQ